MAVLTGLFRLGRDAEVRYTQGGDAVAQIALAYNYGRKGEDGKQPSQWIDASLWGKRAESLAQYLTKGSTISAVLSDVHIRTYEKKDGGQGFAMSARVLDLEFAGKPQGVQQQAKPAPKPAAKPASADVPFEDDEIPF
jgi:single-strand DNA-binding protein